MENLQFIELKLCNCIILTKKSFFCLVLFGLFWNNNYFVIISLKIVLNWKKVSKLIMNFIKIYNLMLIMWKFSIDADNNKVSIIEERKLFIDYNNKKKSMYFQFAIFQDPFLVVLNILIHLYIHCQSTSFSLSFSLFFFFSFSLFFFFVYFVWHFYFSWTFITHLES